MNAVKQQTLHQLAKGSSVVAGGPCPPSGGIFEGAPKVKLKCPQRYISGKEHKGFSYFLLVSQPQIGYTTLSFVIKVLEVIKVHLL